MTRSSQCPLIFSKRTAPGMSDCFVAGNLNNYIAYAWLCDFSCSGEGHRIHWKSLDACLHPFAKDETDLFLMNICQHIYQGKSIFF